MRIGRERRDVRAALDLEGELERAHWMLNQPAYLPANLATAPLDFDWSNGIAVSFGNPDEQPMRLAKAVWAIDYKAKAALALASLEWVAWRLQAHTDVSDLLNRLEAAWASTVDASYAKSLDLDDVRDDVHFRDSADGPRQTALVLLDRWHFGWQKSLSGLEQIAIMCAHLAQHVTGGRGVFEAWLQPALTALTAAHPCSPTFDRGARKFNHSAEPPVPRGWFETLAVPPYAAADRSAWDGFLRGLDPADNLYLVPAVEMRANGFVGDPYRLGREGSSGED